MVPIKRRSFMQGIAAAVFAGLGIKAKEVHDDWQYTEFLDMLKRDHEANLEHLEGEQVEVISEGAEYELGTRRVMPDGRVFRYVQAVGPKGNLYQGCGFCGVNHGSGWIQTKGQCMVNTVDGDNQVEVMVDLEGY